MSDKDRIRALEDAFVRLNHFSGWAEGKINMLEKIGVALIIEGLLALVGLGTALVLLSVR